MKIVNISRNGEIKNKQVTNGEIVSDGKYFYEVNINEDKITGKKIEMTLGQLVKLLKVRDKEILDITKNKSDMVINIGDKILIGEIIDGNNKYEVILEIVNNRRDIEIKKEKVLKRLVVHVR